LSISRITEEQGVRLKRARVNSEDVFGANEAGVCMAVGYSCEPGSWILVDVATNNDSAIVYRQNVMVASAHKGW
jgi:hypothetical protein